MVVLSTEGAQAMVFPTAETLPELKNIAGKGKKSGPLALVNSQIAPTTTARTSSAISESVRGRRKTKSFSRSSSRCIGSPSSVFRERPFGC